ncbi:TnsA-like heteromeric transposase endonuclease subunit, partial [Streptomyces sp. NPDC055105]|uniref:TnsA-like heteromeric transposase endonuclease subunit n=1 Tax=Streptomyces sp. NPDC055105 TaxID=3365719 RepID=UPI0037CD646E
YRFVYLLPTWRYFLWNLRSQSPGVHDQGEGSVDVLFQAVGRTAECSRWLAAASEVVFERCPPLKLFPVHKGKRLAPGWWWSATTGRLVHYGSAATRLHVMLLDRDPRVSGLAARPLELRWREPGGARAHAPQLMPRLADGQGVLADCTARPELSQRQRSLAAVVGEICAAVGWRYWVLGPVDPVYRRDVAWLAGDRHPRYHGGPQLAAALQEAFAEPDVARKTATEHGCAAGAGRGVGITVADPGAGLDSS